MQRDLRILQIIQKAREFNDSDLLNEDLVQSLVNSEIQGLKGNEKAKIATCINELIKAKEKATLS